MDKWSSYINKSFECSCGKVHSCGIEHVVIEENAILKLEEILNNYSYKNLTVVFDVNTYNRAGIEVCEVLDNMGKGYKIAEFDDWDLVPNENAVGSLMVQTDENCDLLIAAGSGTIKDLCAYVAHRLKIDYFVVASAPSMDGYASNVSPLIINHLKTTYEAKVPKAIIGDINILKNAPLNMISAGAGDILGKYISLADWQISHIVNEEYYCPYVAGLVKDSIESVMSGIKGVRSRDGDSIKKIMEGLILSGIAISYIGNSRPASGSEHHLSHYWEMIFISKNEYDILHGTKVGVGTVICTGLYKKLLALDNLTARVNYNFEDWEKDIKHAYKETYHDVIELEKQVGKNLPENVERRTKAFLENRDEINKIISELPQQREIEEALREMGAPCTAEEIWISDVVETSILYAKDLRNRYGMLQILYDFDLFNDIL